MGSRSTGAGDADQKAPKADRDEEMGWEMSDLIDRHGPYDPHDTTFAVGHYVEDRLVWFDFLTATVDDIMRECAFPPEEREARQDSSPILCPTVQGVLPGAAEGPRSSSGRVVHTSAPVLGPLRR